MFSFSTASQDQETPSNVCKTMKLLLFALAMMAVITAATALSIADAKTPRGNIIHHLLQNEFIAAMEWNAFKAAHGKVFSGSPIVEKFRMKIYMQNKAMIAEHNRLAHLGHHSYFLKMNHFGDLLHNEFVTIMNGFQMDLRKNNTPHDSGATFIAPEGFEAPTEVDWRTKGAVTEVKDQGRCASCWAFSTTGSLEGQHFRKTGKLVSLSEQNLVDCSNDLEYQNLGCGGGHMGNAFMYIRDNHGLDTESSYPYTGHDDICHFKRSSVGATDKGFVELPAGDEKALAVAVAAHGPVSVGIDSSHISFQFYNHGIYDEPKCSPDTLVHAVLVVGYGPGYWLVKNSWSAKWGMDGYIKMKRGGNQCGIATIASYPLV